MIIHRRSFLKNTAITVLGSGIVAAVPLEVLAAIRKRVAPSDMIRVGVIGVRGQGWSDLTSMLRQSEVQCVAMCDIDQNVLSNRRSDLQKLNVTAKEYGDYRKLLDNKDIDLVIIGTPDHWHCLQMTDAVSAGKDVFVEKPVANSIYEAKL
ncbi:MAG: Gfo/Idh/MocA family protein, partial [Flavisolibacter sp.]